MSAGSGTPPPGVAEADRRSRALGTLQTVLFVLFAAVYFLDHGMPLFRSGIVGIVGGVLCALGLVLMGLAIRDLGGAIQIAPAPREDARLVTRGVYAHFRHPIYTGIVAVVVGLALRRPTLLVVLAAAIVIAFLVFKTSYEETLLLLRYDEYAEYRKHTRGILF